MAPNLRPLFWLLMACIGLYLVVTFVTGPRKRPHLKTVEAAAPPVSTPGPVTAPTPAMAAPTVMAAASPTPAPAPAPAAPPTPSPDPAAPSKLTITFWNVEWFPGRRPKAGPEAGQAHLAAVVPVLERLNPDVLGLEEVADWAAAKSIADHLKGFKVDVCSPFIAERSGSDITKQQQVVLCSRLPVLQAWAEPWKPGENAVQPPRGFAFAAYQPAPGKVLLVYALHLKSNRVEPGGSDEGNHAMREESSRQLLVHQQAMEKAYGSMGKVSVVMGGDLNTSLDDPKYAPEQTLRSWQAVGFKWGWENVPFADRATLPANGKYPAVCFDHLFFRGEGFKVLKAFVEPTGKDSSDHRPVTTEVEL
jgi:endonuclease/exonuclease/phosphatase (EEP) superfamily protein YafD